jgi:recombinational DNA repair protein (RecF pathway)
VAKGARRRKSTLASALQLFSLLAVRLSVRPAGGLANLISADVLERPDYARGDKGREALARFAYAGFFAEILSSTHENDPHGADLFALARAFFTGLAAAPHPGSFALQGFFALLAALGYAPHLGAPVGTGGGDIRPGAQSRRVYRLNLIEGTLRAPHSPPAPKDFVLTPPALETLRRLVAVAPRDAFREPVSVGRRIGPTLVRLAIRMFETHLERSLRSARFLEEMILKDSGGN